MTTTTGVATEFIDFTRASNATVTDSDGLVKWAPHNLLLASESFDAAAWVKTNSTVIANTSDTTAPNSTSTADKLRVTTANSPHGAVFDAASLTLATGTKITVSVFAKKGELSWCLFGDGQQTGVYFNLDTGSIGTVTAGWTGEGITPIGTTGWYLLTCSVTSVTSSSLAVYAANANNGVVFTGANNTDGIYIWGASLYRSDLAMQPNTSAYPMYNPTTPRNRHGYTEDFSNAAWTKYRSSIGVSTTAPNGLQTADKLVPQNAQSDGGMFAASYPAIVSGGVYTASIYVKAAELGFVFVGLNSRASSTSQGLCVNLATGARSNEGVSGTYTVTDAGDGWWRISCTGTSSVSSATVEVWPRATAGSWNGYTGDGTSGIYIWGAQLSDSASLDSYVPVYGAAVTSAAYYGPRRDFDGATLACKGLLVEEQRTNSLLQSAAFDTASWNKADLNTSGTPAWVDVAIAPDGTQTADAVVEGSGTVQPLMYQSLSTLSGAVSVYVKSNGRNFVQIVNSSGYANFDLSTGLPGTVSGFTSPIIVPVGSGWYRISTVVPISSVVGIGIVPSSTSGYRASYTGNGTSGIYIWGAQFEASKDFPTSYIPVGATSAGATRNADRTTISPQAFPYSSAEGTWVFNISRNTAGGNNWIFGASPSNQCDMVAGNSSVNFRYGLTGGIDAESNYVIGSSGGKAAGAYTTGGTHAISVNGNAVLTSGISTDPGTATLVRLGVDSTPNPGRELNGHIRQITYLPRRISNAELVTRST